MELLVVLLLIVVVWLLLKNTKNKELLKSEVDRAEQLKKSYQEHSQKIEKRHSEQTNQLESERDRLQNELANSVVATTGRRIPKKQSSLEEQQSAPASQSSGVPELDGPGMQHRLTSIGPAAHAVYVLYSAQHQAFKVGVSVPNKLAARVLRVKADVPDVVVVGTKVFTSTANAKRREDEIHRNLSRYRYRGIQGRDAGRNEWFTRKPKFFPTPQEIEAKYAREQSRSHRIDEDDIYTLYLVKSESKGQYLIKWCKTENLPIKLRNIKRATPDAKLVARIPFDNQVKVRAACISHNGSNYRKVGRRDIFEWSANQPAIEKFDSWTANAKRK